MNSSISILCFGLLCLFCWSNLTKKALCLGVNCDAPCLAVTGHYDQSTVTQGELVLDCCLKVSHVEIPKRIVKSYENQVKGQGCDIDATVFTTRRNIKLCAPTEPRWVKALMATVDSRLKQCQQKNFQAAGRSRQGQIRSEIVEVTLAPQVAFLVIKPKWCHGLQE